MTRAVPPRYLRPASALTWVTDRNCTLVVNETDGAVFQLTGLNEVLWDCLAQGFSFAKILQMVAEMRGGSLPTAEDWVLATLREWRDLGLLREEDAHG